jgi:hypothetical protein
MEFTVNTEEKTITITGEVNLKEITDTIKKLFPDDWKEYSIKSELIWNQITYPVIPSYPTTPTTPIAPTYPTYPTVYY